MPDEVQKFLKTYPREVRDLALQARELVRTIVPEAEEKVLRPWKTIAYGLGRKFCAISPYGSWVNLHFHQGALLPDPSGLLRGTETPDAFCDLPGIFGPGIPRERPLSAALLSSEWNSVELLFRMSGLLG